MVGSCHDDDDDESWMNLCEDDRMMVSIGCEWILRASHSSSYHSSFIHDIYQPSFTHIYRAYQYNQLMQRVHDDDESTVDVFEC